MCLENGADNAYYCKDPPSPPARAPSNNCPSVTCSLDQIPSPKCICGHPFAGTIVFRSRSFSTAATGTWLQDALMGNFHTDHLPVDTISLKSLDDQSWYLQVFPLGKASFSQTEISTLSFLLGNNDTGNPFDFYPEGSYAKYTGKPVLFMVAIN